MSTEADYIFVGGGLPGSTMAARLHQGNPSLRIIVLEVRPNPSENPNVAPAMDSFTLTASDSGWQYLGLPGASTNNRVHINSLSSRKARHISTRTRTSSNMDLRAGSHKSVELRAFSASLQALENKKLLE
jgi:choline dehydrogenase-like flavoprotein